MCLCVKYLAYDKEELKEENIYDTVPSKAIIIIIIIRRQCFQSHEKIQCEPNKRRDAHNNTLLCYKCVCVCVRWTMTEGVQLSSRMFRSSFSLLKLCMIIGQVSAVVSHTHLLHL